MQVLTSSVYTNKLVDLLNSNTTSNSESIPPCDKRCKPIRVVSYLAYIYSYIQQCNAAKFRKKMAKNELRLINTETYAATSAYYAQAVSPEQVSMLPVQRCRQTLKGINTVYLGRN